MLLLTQICWCQTAVLRAGPGQGVGRCHKTSNTLELCGRCYRHLTLWNSVVAVTDILHCGTLWPLPLDILHSGTLWSLLQTSYTLELSGRCYKHLTLWNSVVAVTDILHSGTLCSLPQDILHSGTLCSLPQTSYTLESLPQTSYTLELCHRHLTLCNSVVAVTQAWV